MIRSKSEPSTSQIRGKSVTCVNPVDAVCSHPSVLKYWSEDTDCNTSKRRKYKNSSVLYKRNRNTWVSRSRNCFQLTDVVVLFTWRWDFTASSEKQPVGSVAKKLNSGSRDKPMRSAIALITTLIFRSNFCSFLKWNYRSESRFVPDEPFTLDICSNGLQGNDV